MSEILANPPKPQRSIFDYLVLSLSLLVPTIGSLALLVFLDHSTNERLTLGGAAVVYLAIALLGLFSFKRFKNYGRTESWTLIAGIALNGISSLVAASAVILSYAFAGLHIH